ncbi:MAG: nicotinate phosphoribosyltransferase [Chloroflexi bacterium]|nr:nicotinate phosphoribosyltransferase [Chloroflexota bacterium]
MTVSDPSPWALLTDLYELTMAQTYMKEGMNGRATFSLFVRRLPPDRGYMVVAGLEDVLRYLQRLRFSSEDLEYLRSTKIFDDAFLSYLEGFRFTGEVWAAPEGGVLFANEPFLEVTAPIAEAQLVETYVINQVHLQSMLATKAARCAWAARGRRLVDFGLRRTHGADAGMKAARSCYIAGFHATSNVLAGKAYGMPIAGTMAHSFVTSFPEEIDAFRAYARTFPDSSTFLIDTYDTVEGAQKAAVVAKEMEEAGHRLRAVRLDSGDLLALSRQVRHVLDEAGLPYVTIFASGGLDEYQVADLLLAEAPIDGFGVGTRMGVSADAPFMDIAYKLVEYAGRPVLKLSSDKVTLAHRKQVYRRSGPDGRFLEDTLALRDEALNGAGEPLLVKAMEDGRMLGAPPSLEEVRRRFREEFARLPEQHKALREAPAYPVHLSPGLADLQSRLERELATPGGRA